MSKRPPPRFHGIRIYRDPDGVYQFHYPTDWAVFGLSEERDGIMLSPEAKSPATWFSAWKVKLLEAVVAEDLPELRAGLDEGLAQLGEGCSLQTSTEAVMGNLIKFERVHTFREMGTLRKRRQWVLYVDRWQIVLIYQGASVEEYEYWLAMANYSFYTFDLPNELWFATDRDLSGLGKPTN